MKYSNNNHNNVTTIFTETDCLLIITAFIVFSLSFFLFSCSDNRTSTNVENETNQTTKEVTLTTGSAGKEIEWKINEVKRTDCYTRAYPTVEVVEADSVELKGEARPSEFMQTVPIFDRGFSFLLMDKQGYQFSQSDFGTGTEKEIGIWSFSAPFALADKGKKNADVKSWSDLIIKDPDPASASLPGHQASLAIFDSE